MCAEIRLGLGSIRRHRLMFFTLVLTLLMFGTSARGQIDVILESWESGVGNWTSTVGNGAQVSGGASLATSNLGATEGVNSLAVTQNGDTFELDPLFNSAYSYNAEVRYQTGDAQLDALNQAFLIGAEFFELRLDVTYVTASIPAGATSMNTGIALEGGAAPFNRLEGLAPSNLSQPSQTINIARPLNDWLVPQTETTFFDITFGLNGDWGGDSATVYFDNLRLVQVGEPAILDLEVDRGDGSVRIVNRSSPGNDVAFSYYEILSPGGALDPVNWESLDDFLVPDEGWRKAGGASVFDLTEANLLSSSTLDGGEFFSLGQAFTPGSDETGMVFHYREPSRPSVLREGTITFLGDPPAPDCDFDNSGQCDLVDADLLVVEIVDVANGGVADLAFDLTGDGDVTRADLDQWLVAAGAESVAITGGNPFLGADANLDGTVDVSDFNIWNSNKFQMLAAFSGGDFNADGFVDVADFNIWNSAKFTSSNPGVVPEPATVLWMFAGPVWLVTLGRGRRAGR